MPFNNKKRIFYIIGSLDIGGAEYQLIKLSKRLVQLGWTVSIVTITHEGALAAEARKDGINILASPFDNVLKKLPKYIKIFFYFYFSVMHILRLIIIEKYKIVHAFLPLSCIIAGLISLVFCRVSTVMSRRSLNIYKKSNPILHYIERYFIKRADFVIGNSIAVYNELISEGVDGNNLNMIYNGVDCQEIIKKKEINKNNYLMLPENCISIIMVANMHPYKGHIDLLRAFHLAKSQSELNLYLLIVGSDLKIGEFLRQFARELGISDRIKWLGLRDDVMSLYMYSDIGILCSHQEGFSNSILEGMAAGLPMIVTDVGGNAEAIINGKCGIVVAKSDIISLSKAILLLASDQKLRDTFGKAARERCLQEFSISAVVDSHLKIYNSLIFNSVK